MSCHPSRPVQVRAYCRGLPKRQPQFNEFVLERACQEQVQQALQRIKATYNRRRLSPRRGRGRPTVRAFPCLNF